MNEVIKYEEFITKPIEEQKELMTSWRELYKNREIQDSMGLAVNPFNKLIDDLGVPKKNTNQKGSNIKVTLSDEELEVAKENLIKWEDYRNLILEQQALLLEGYLSSLELKSITALQEVWDESDSSYLYSVRNRHNAKLERLKKKEKEQKKFEKEQQRLAKLAEKDSKQETVIVENDSSKESRKSLEQTMKQALNLINSKKSQPSDSSPVEHPLPPDEEQVEVIEEIIEELQDVVSEVVSNDETITDSVEDYNSGHTTDVSMQTGVFSFIMNGQYSATTIRKRLELALSVLDDESEMLDLEIKITSK